MFTQKALGLSKIKKVINYLATENHNHHYIKQAQKTHAAGNAMSLYVHTNNIQTLPHKCQALSLPLYPVHASRLLLSLSPVCLCLHDAGASQCPSTCATSLTCSPTSGTSLALFQQPEKERGSKGGREEGREYINYIFKYACGVVDRQEMC